MGKEITFLKYLFSDYLELRKCFVGLFGVSLAANGKGLCEVRATATGSGEENETLAKTIFIFFKFTKKNEMVFAGTAYKFSEISFNPASCKTHVICRIFYSSIFINSNF